MVAGPPGPESLARLGRILAAAGYDEERLERFARLGGPLDLEEGLAVLPLRADGDAPLAVLARLFANGEALPEALAAGALAPLTPRELGPLLLTRDGLVRARVRLQPFGRLLVASDFQRRPRRDHVTGIALGPRILSALTPRRPVGDALDLCTGSGVLALGAAAHAERVVATDVNPRALRLARTNAALNGVENVDWRLGDLFEPVASDRFDLVVVNPPFVIAPRSDYLYRESDARGDELSRVVVQGVAERLRPGGYGFVLCNWAGSPREAWSAPVRRWLRGRGCDAWLLRQRTDTAVSYALRWNRMPGRPLAAAAAAAPAWLDHLRSHGIEEVTTGVVVLRRRRGRNWVREDELVGLPGIAAPAQLERVFQAQDLLRGLADEGLLDLPLALAPGAAIVERRTSGGTVERARVALPGGLALPGRVPPSCARLTGSLDGGRPLRAAVAAAARAARVDAEELAAQALPALRDLVARGLLVAGPPPPGPPGSTGP